MTTCAVVAAREWATGGISNLNSLPDHNMYTLAGRYCTPKLCAHSYQSEGAHNLLLYVQYGASVCTLLPIGIAFSVTIHLPQVAYEY